MEDVRNAITRRIASQHYDLIGTYGITAVTEAIDSIAAFVGDVEEIGGSDLSGWARCVREELGRRTRLDSPFRSHSSITSPAAKG